MTSIIVPTVAEICATFGRRVRQRRLSLNLTQAELGARAGVSSGAVRKLESGGLTTLATFVKCVQALGAAHDLESLLVSPVQSIAQMTQQLQGANRMRARRAVRPRSA